MNRYLVILLVATLVVLTHGRSRATGDEKVYLMVFSAQAEPAKARTSHSSATIVRVKGNGPDVRNGSVEEYTINWLPATGNIQPYHRPEPGRNFDLAETFDWAQRHGARVTMWGPYEVDPELLVFAQRQIEQLDSGQVAYRMLDSLTRPKAVNCIHAVSDMVPGEPLVSGSAFGDSASVTLVRHLRRWIKQPKQTHDAVLIHLGLNTATLRRQPYPE